MNVKNRHPWSTEACAALDNAELGDELERIQAAWTEHSAFQQPVVTFVGPYNAGKSSLIKRLLVDNNVAIPDWLGVSGRRETFVVNHESVLGCLLKDTPGLSGGSAEHEARALEALLLTDVVVLVLPPQLLTSGLDVMVSLLDGSAFFGNASKPMSTSSTLFVVQRMDQAGASPDDDLHEYSEVCKAKKKELQALLGKNGLSSLGAAHIHTVAADPFQMVGNLADVLPKMYDDERKWDGIRALSEDLATIPSRLEKVRAAAELRYFGCQVAFANDALKRRLDKAKIAIQACDSELERVRMIGDQTDETLETHASLLDRRLNEEFLVARRQGAETLPEILSGLEPRVTAAISEGTEALLADLDSIRTRIDDVAENRAKRPTTRLLSQYMIAVDETDEASWPGRAKDGLNLCSRFGPALLKALRERHEFELGMTLPQANQELMRIARAGSLSNHLKQTGKKALLTTTEKVEKAKKVVKLNNILEKTLPVILELGSYCLGQAEKKKEQQADVELREQRRLELNNAATEIVAAVLKDWAPLTEDIKAWVNDNAQVYADRQRVLAGDIGRLEDATEAMPELLRRWPG
jgi:predicted GTPase